MNNVELIGRLVRDPRAGNGVASFTIAVDRATQENATDYPQIKVFGKQGETVMKYLHKGSQVAIQGSLETGSYPKNGETIYYTDVVAHRVEFIGGNAKQAESVKKAPANEPEQVDSFEAVDEDVPF